MGIRIEENSVYFDYKDNTFSLESNPLEDNLYIFDGDDLVCTINHAFTTEKIIAALSKGDSIIAPDGNMISEAALNKILAYIIDSSKWEKKESKEQLQDELDSLIIDKKDLVEEKKEEINIVEEVTEEIVESNVIEEPITEEVTEKKEKPFFEVPLFDEEEVIEEAIIEEVKEETIVEEVKEETVAEEVKEEVKEPILIDAKEDNTERVEVKYDPNFDTEKAREDAHKHISLEDEERIQQVRERIEEKSSNNENVGVVIAIAVVCVLAICSKFKCKKKRK